ncbi:MAG: DUF5985 family protein [Ramlibacter sp.]
MDNLLLGGIAAGSLVAGLFFFRFWRQTRDRFFLLFAASFWLEAANRTVFGLLPHADEDEPIFYLVRLLSYALILLAIWQKNRRPAR